MALTQEDVQLIKEALRPEFEQLEKRFNQVDRRLDGIDTVLEDLVEAVTVEANERYSDHEARIKALEQKLHTP